MFEFVRKHTRLLQFLLALVIVPSFIFVGVQGYTSFNEAGNQAVAKVDGRPITQAEWDAAHQRQIERIRQQMPNVDLKMLDTPEMKQRTLEELVRERVMGAAVQKMHLQASDNRVAHALNTLPELAMLRGPDGRLDRERYKQLLAAQGMSEARFEATVRDDLSRRQVGQGILESGFAPAKLARVSLDALLQKREVQAQVIDARQFLAQVNPSDAELQAYYDKPANQAQFRAPEQASIEYVVLDLDTLKQQVSVSEKALRDYYEQNISRYSVPEERHAAHILVKAEASAPAAEREKAKTKAQGLLAEVRKNPGAFAELARKHSDDPGSKEQGGDLGFFDRQAMVKPFADAVYSMKPSEISDIVETDFGFHIIKFIEARGGDKKPFEAVRAEIESEYRRQEAQRKYPELAEQFSRLVYEQSDSLQPAVDQLKLEKRTAMITREPLAGEQGPLSSQKFIDAVFASETVRNKHNTEAIEFGPNAMASARVVQHQPARVLPLAEVKDRVRQRLALEQAAALARKAGAERLQALQQGGDAAPLPAAVVVQRGVPSGLPQSVVEAVLRADASKLPHHFGVDLGLQGYAVVRLNKVDMPELPQEEFQRMAQSWAGASASAEAQAYLEALKRRYKAEVKAKAPPKPADDSASQPQR